jgi:hypothetical protein
MNIPVTFGTIARMAVLTVIGFVVASLIPAYDDYSAATINIAVAVIYAAVVSVILGQAAGRRAKLLDAVRLELNKLRRLYHISKNLAAGSQERFRVWFTDVHGHLYGYLGFFTGKDFSAYDDSNIAFRKLSYHIYTIPEVESRKEQALFDDILRTTGQIAEARQQIKELWDNRLSAYAWTSLLLLTGAFIVTTAFAAGDSFAARTAAGAAFAVALLVLDLIWEIDTLAAEKNVMAGRYVSNLAKLELKRETKS